MSVAKKTEKIRIFTGAALSASIVILGWMFLQPRFRNIVSVFLAAVIAAFLVETAVLMILKGSNPVKRIIKIILLFIINISIFFFAVSYAFAPAVILQPHSDDEAYINLQDIPLAEEISFTGENGAINGWFYNAAGESAPTVLYFYGNYETASTRLYNLSKNYEASAFAGCNFAVFDYPSYGKSEGSCNDKAMLRFALDVYDKISEFTDDIIVLGYSVGTGPACYLAANREIKGLILYAPFADSKDLYNNVVDIFHGPLEFLVAFDMPNKEYVKNITEKTLILASEGDEVIPAASSVNLATEFGGECTIIKTEGITHNQFLSDSFIREKTGIFIKEVTAE